MVLLITLWPFRLVAPYDPNAIEAFSNMAFLPKLTFTRIAFVPFVTQHKTVIQLGRIQVDPDYLEGPMRVTEEIIRQLDPKTSKSLIAPASHIADCRSRE